LTHSRQMLVIKHGVAENGLIICYILLGIGLLSLIFLLTNAVIIKVSPDRIVLQRIFSRSIIPKEAIVSIDLMAREKLLERRSGLVDAIVVHRGDRRFRIRVDVYSNTPDIKRAIQRYMLPGQPYEIPETKKLSATGIDRSPETYSRSWLTSGCGVMLLCVVILSWLFFLGIVSGPLPVRIGLVIALTLAAYLGGGNVLYYFQIDKQELIVRNHFFPWVSRRFSLVEIRSVAVENRPALTIALSITTIDFECRSFIAESLRRPEWKALAERLAENGIAVVDEAYD
jgi:hypothetical protein